MENRRTLSNVYIRSQSNSILYTSRLDFYRGRTIKFGMESEAFPSAELRLTISYHDRPNRDFVIGSVLAIERRFFFSSIKYYIIYIYTFTFIQSILHAFMAV